MKKSEAYRVAQVAVLGVDTLSPEDRLAIISILMEDEKLALWCEEQEAKKDDTE